MLALSSASGSLLRIQPSNVAPPFLRGQAPARVARHDFALAQREAAGVQARGSLRRRSAETLSVAAFDDQRVVLVGDEGLLHAPFAAEREPAPCARQRVRVRQRARSVCCVSASLSALIMAVSCSAATPCASSWRASSRTSAAPPPRAAESLRRRGSARQCATGSSRCRAKRSRSETTPASLPSRVTTT